MRDDTIMLLALLVFWAWVIYLIMKDSDDV